MNPATEAILQGFGQGIGVTATLVTLMALWQVGKALLLPRAMQAQFKRLNQKP